MSSNPSDNKDQGISGSITAKLSALQHKYDSFVQESKWYAPMIDTLKSFGILLPGRFSGEDITGEAFYTFLNVLSYYHDGVLGKPRSHPSEIKLSGYPASITQQPPEMLRWLNGILFVLSSAECLLEIGAGQIFMKRNQTLHDRLFSSVKPNFFVRKEQRLFTGRMQTFKWRVILVIELLKLLVRLRALMLNRGKILLAPGPADMEAELLSRQTRAEVAQYERYLADRGVCAWGGSAYSGGAAQLSAATPTPTDAVQPAATTNDPLVPLEQPSMDSSSPVSPSAPPVATPAAAAAKKPTDKERARRDKEQVPHEEWFHATRLMYAQHGRGVVPHGEFAPMLEPYLQDLRARGQASVFEPAQPPPGPERREYRPPLHRVASEVLYWSRPLAYVAARLRCGERSWTPLLLSAVVDALAWLLAAPASKLSAAQREQWATRTRLYWLYLFRAPLLRTVTLLPVRVLERFLGRVPLLGWLLSALRAIALILEQHYFYTAAS